MLFDSRTGQCIGPCVPSIAALPPATPYAPLQYTPAQFALLPASIPLEMPSKKKKPSTSSSSSSRSSTSTHTLQRKLKKRERAKAQSSRKKDKGRLPRSIRRRHRSKDGQSSAKPSRKKGKRQRSELRSPRKQPRTVSRSATRPVHRRRLSPPNVDRDRYRARSARSSTRPAAEAQSPACTLGLSTGPGRCQCTA